MFTDQQVAALSAPLNADNVRTRAQSGRELSYIEGWKAIEEANRIFGFDAWTRETIDIRCVAEIERKIGAQKRDGWGVSYVAKVRISVSDVFRDGVGAGHGIDADKGLAHESAIKEAETDAMKRAMMTFGNPFGLALYDKAMANVKKLPKKDARDVYTKLQAEIRAATTLDELRAWGEDNKERIGVLPMDWQDILRALFHERLVELRQLGTKASAPPVDGAPNEEPDHDADGVIWDDPPVTEAEHSKWSMLSPVKQAAIRCNEPAFWKFLGVGDALLAAEEVRHRCNVGSRADLGRGGVATSLWRDIDAAFIAWKHADASPVPPGDPAAAQSPPPPPAAAGNEDESERIALLDFNLDTAASLGGMDGLRKVWAAIPKSDQAILKVALDTRHKKTAAEADARK